MYLSDREENPVGSEEIAEIKVADRRGLPGLLEIGDLASVWRGHPRQRGLIARSPAQAVANPLYGLYIVGLPTCGQHNVLSFRLLGIPPGGLPTFKRRFIM